LLIAQPKQVLAHDPDPPSRIRVLWNHDYLATAAKFMGFDPSTSITVASPVATPAQNAPHA
jgi:hypothetical protein